MSNAMKLLLALSLILVSTVKPYDGNEITVTHTTVNDSDARLIYGYALRDNQKVFLTLKCNEDEKSCPAPGVGQAYTLVASDGVYNCDEYTLVRTGFPRIVICLVGAS